MVRPKKHLGQHFLTDLNIARRIVDSLSENDNVLEIGPGKGVLSQFLIEKDLKELILVELDKESVIYLKDNFQEHDFKVVSGDVLKTPFSEFFSGKSFSLIGNFPYNISSQIVFKAVEERQYINELVGMFQREMARRICSPPGNKDYGILSVLCQAYFDCKYLFTVKEGVFFPPPKVKSGVISLKKKVEDNGIDSYSKFSKMVKMAFNQRRKQLRNTLKPMLPENFEHELLSQRPEQLHWSDFLDIYNSIKTS